MTDDTEQINESFDDATQALYNSKSSGNVQAALMHAQRATALFLQAQAQVQYRHVIATRELTHQQRVSNLIALYNSDLYTDEKATILKTIRAAFPEGFTEPRVQDQR